MKETKINNVVDLALGRLNPGEALDLLDTIGRDTDASEALDLAADLVNLAGEKEGNVFLPPARRGVRIHERVILWIRRLDDAHGKVWPVGVLSAVAILMALGLGAQQLISSRGNRYEELLRIDAEPMEWNVRGPQDADLAVAGYALAKGDEGDALRYLERYLRVHPESDVAPFVHYSAGAICLKSARSTILTFLPAYNEEQVMKGLAHLRHASLTAPSQDLRDQSRFLRAKGFLMLQQDAEAIAELDSVIDSGSGRSAEATLFVERITSHR
jgi:hypothetical protein